MDKNQFALTPPMGWNSYDYYDTTVNEAQVRANGAYMAAHLKEYGWEYIVVDIQWYAHGAGSRREEFQYIPFSKLELDGFSRLLPDPERFPSSKDGAGFGPLADYIHSLGLKFGIHIMRGIPRIAAQEHMPIAGSTATADQIADPSSICGWNPDMYGILNTAAGQRYYDSLLELYASWGVDFIKCDDICNLSLYPASPYAARHEVEMLSSAIARCGRPIVLSLSPGPALIEEAWHYENHANMWRITGDFWDDWRLLKDMFSRCALWQRHVSKGCYPDCDMLPLGRVGKGFGAERATGFTPDEQKTMMTLWCLFGSPLMLGAELTKLDEETLSLLTNRDVLGMLTPDCRPHMITLDESRSVWSGTNRKENTVYAALFNLSEEMLTVSVAIGELGLDESNAVENAMELWAGTVVGIVEGRLSAGLPPHGCAVYRLSEQRII